MDRRLHEAGDIWDILDKLKSAVTGAPKKHGGAPQDIKPAKVYKPLPPTVAAGVLMYRMEAGELDVFLVRPGGPFYAGQNKGIWSIPKGTVEKGENIKKAAIREFEEETGLKPKGKLIELGPVAIRSSKIVHAWAFEGNVPNGFKIKSNTFEMGGKEYPEVDDGRFFPLDDAYVYIYPGQAEFLKRLESKLNLK